MPGVTNSNLKKAFIVPGLPHLAFGDADKSTGWQELKSALEKAGADARDAKPDVLVIYSAQWISVLGHSFQANPNPKGLHVDENWYDMGEFSFDFKVDVKLAEAAEALARQKGLATKLVNYEGFPIDTGTLVTLKYFNPDNSIPVLIVSSNIYCGQEDSVKLGEAIGEALKASNKKAVLINCSSLSHRFLTEEIDPAKDKIASDSDDTWNRKMLDLLKQGKNKEAMAMSAEYVKNANPERGFKGFYWLMGALEKSDVPPEVSADVLAYGPIWGTGAAVVEYSLNN